MKTGGIAYLFGNAANQMAAHRQPQMARPIKMKNATANQMAQPNKMAQPIK